MGTIWRGTFLSHFKEKQSREGVWQAFKWDISQNVHNVTVAVDTGKDSPFSSEREGKSVLRQETGAQNVVFKYK